MSRQSLSGRRHVPPCRHRRCGTSRWHLNGRRSCVMLANCAATLAASCNLVVKVFSGWVFLGARRVCEKVVAEQRNRSDVDIGRGLTISFVSCLNFYPSFPLSHYELENPHPPLHIFRDLCIERRVFFSFTYFSNYDGVRRRIQRPTGKPKVRHTCNDALPHLSANKYL